ncbi:mitochondrial large subunit ribosomal protein-domain-containing protein [Hypoxylon rubiginosum]|uniref:Mitochondrial large subunit ribosomal protein-domain-containing protein n=1 Tax=Hypoxylon rubiginosum TaxID=110542 RepID=A0ACC0CJT3_9PEZI|nr:mitochondrial large subunit ribosomal protein-domain-containing protein [Hypoxylon rubiginosum]
MLLPRVLRPLAASRTPLSLFSPRFILPVRTRCLSTTIEQPSSSDSTTPLPSEPIAQSQPQAPSQLPYFVGRNNLNSLGIYQQKKRGGNLKVTLVKNAEGDVKALKADIKEALQLDDGDISINSVTRHIVIRGHKRVQVLNFLTTVGF